jgi:RND family efflux transporter MFP subunit
MKNTTHQKWLLLAFIAGTFFIASCKKELPTKEPVRPVRAIKVGDTEGVTSRSFPGQAEATEEVNLTFEVPGRLVERPVDRGDEVKKGDLLARLDPRDYENDLATAQARQVQAKAYWERIDKAVKTGAVAEQDLTDAQAAFDVAKAEVRIKQKALDDTQIKAPYDGSIAATYVENYEQVRSKQNILRLLDISKIEVTVAIPENLILMSPYIKELSCRFDAFADQELIGHIKEVGTEASTTTRTFPVTVIMEQPKDFKVLPGMACTIQAKPVEFPEGQAQIGYIVPVSSLSTDTAGKSYVWVIDEASHMVKQQEVVNKGLTSVGVQIQGVEKGQWVATAGVHTLREGQKVRILEEVTQ